MSAATNRSLEPEDRGWVLRFVWERWGSDRMVRKGEIFYPAEHEGFLALVDGQPVGVATYEITDRACEVTLIDSGTPQAGIGTALLAAVEDAARQANCERLWLITTNDNLDALRFYQRRGFVLKALYPNSLEEGRRLKPEMGTVGDFGIPLRDEIELEKLL